MSGRVLVVDDDVSVGTVLAGLLEQAGYSAQSVLNAHDAMAQVELESIDVVISDIRMPGMSGMQLLTELRRAHPDVPVVMLTAHGTVPLAVEAMREGAADFLLKSKSPRAGSAKTSTFDSPWCRSQFPLFETDAATSRFLMRSSES